MIKNKIDLKNLSIPKTNIKSKLKELKQKNKKKFVCVLVIVVVAFMVLLGVFGPKGTSPKSFVSLIGVGNGESMLIQSGNYIYLYNAGSDKEHETAIEDYMRYKGIERLDGIILANNKSRNINRTKKLVKKFDVRNIYMSSFGDNNKAYLSLLDYLDNNKKIKVHYPKMNDKISLTYGDITFIQSDNEYKTMEDASLCIEYTDDRKMSVYAFGDITPTAENDIINNYFKKKKNKFNYAHYVVASNQGRNNTTTYKLLKKVKADTVLVSCSLDDEDLPINELNNAADKNGSDIYVTRNSNIEIDSVKNAGVSVSTTMTDIRYTSTQIKVNNFVSRENEITKHKYVGNRNTYLFYDNTDPIISTISDSNLTYFEDKATAIEAGFTYAPSNQSKSTSGFDKN